MNLLEAWRAACNGELTPGWCKLRGTQWFRDEWFQPFFISTSGAAYGLKQDGGCQWFGIESSVWEPHREAPKLVKWYRPRVVWQKDSHNPSHCIWDFRASKDLSQWFHSPREIKVLEWEEREFPKSWEECE